MTLAPTIGMCVGLFIGNFIGGRITFGTWGDGLAVGLTVIPVYLLFTWILTMCGVALP